MLTYKDTIYKTERAVPEDDDSYVRRSTTRSGPTASVQKSNPAHTLPVDTLCFYTQEHPQEFSSRLCPPPPFVFPSFVIVSLCNGDYNRQSFSFLSFSRSEGQSEVSWRSGEGQTKVSWRSGRDEDVQVEAVVRLPEEEDEHQAEEAGARQTPVQPGQI